MEKEEAKNKRTEFLPHLIILAVFFFLLSQTWFKWGDLIIDTGRELWLPGELLKGKVLYKDIFYLYGFFPAYFIAVLYKIFGVSINTLVYTGIALTLIVSFTVYRIARFFLDEGLSTLLVVNFLFVLAFGCYINCAILNFILPYAFASTFFMMFTALSLYFFLEFVFSGNEKNLMIWALLLTAAFLCRLESTLVVYPAFLLSGFILFVRQPKAKRCRIVAYILTPLILATLCYGLFFLATHTFHDFKETFIRSIEVIANTPLNQRMAGFDDIASNLSQISVSFLLNMAIFITLAMTCRIMAALNCDKSTARTIIPISISFLFFILLKQFSLYELQYRCLVVVLPCGLIAYFVQSLNPEASKRSLALLTLFTTSFLVTYRMFLATSHYWYGFYLLILPLVCYYVFFGDILKSALEDRFKIPKGLLSTAIASFLMLMIIPFWEHSSSYYKYHNKLAVTTKGNIYANNNLQTDIFWKTVDYLKNNTSANSTLAVFPEGVEINFFTDRLNPLKYYSFLPENINASGQDKILSEMRAVKIQYIVILTRDTSDSGPASFGVDYAQKIQKWIDANYIPVKQFGAKPYKSNAVGMLILKRKQ